MKQLLILSGKGGTGKTTIASAFIKLAEAKAYADCDVDAPNLHLICSRRETIENRPFYGFQKAVKYHDLCIDCGKCEELCRFNAIRNGVLYPYECEGCGVCEYVCPVEAINMIPAVAGELMLYSDEEKAFSTAQLKMGSGAPGKLVTAVKQTLTQEAPDDAHLAIIDGSPGIGCPVIASITGVDMVLMV